MNNISYCVGMISLFVLIFSFNLQAVAGSNPVIFFHPEVNRMDFPIQITLKTTGSGHWLYQAMTTRVNDKTGEKMR